MSAQAENARDPEQTEARQDEEETVRPIDQFIADVYSDFVRVDGELHERLGRILDVALRCRDEREEGVWLDLCRSQFRDCRLSIKRKRES